MEILLSAGIFIDSVLNSCEYPNMFDTIPVIVIFCVIFHLFDTVKISLFPEYLAFCMINFEFILTHHTNISMLWTLRNIIDIHPAILDLLSIEYPTQP